MRKLCLFCVLLALAACNSASPVDSTPAAEPATAPTESSPSPAASPARRETRTLGQDARAIAKPWIDDALQIRDFKQRDAAVANVRAALESSDVLQVYAGLIAFNEMRNLTFDKKPFRALVLPHLAAADSSMRVTAMYALDAAGREALDLERVLAAAEGVTGEERHRLVHVIAVYSNGELTGAAGAAVFELIASDERRDVRQSFSGLWGTHVSPEIEKRLLDVSNGSDYENAHDAIYFGLSTLRDKSEAVVDRLVTALSDPDHNNSGRALWGLGQGVPSALQPKVADAMLQLFEARGDSTTRQDALRLLGKYGVESHAAALEALVAGGAADEALRRSMLDAVAQIRRRQPAAPK